MVENNETNIVIDNGTCNIKAGFSGEESPLCVLSNIIGIPNEDEKENAYVIKGESLFIGDEVFNKNSNNIKNPIQNGTITDWDYMEKMWDFIFTNQLRVDPSEHNVMITEKSLNPQINRERIIQNLFETFDVPELCIIDPGVLSLYSAGKFDGISIDSGEGITSFVPIYDGYSLKNSIIKIDLAGKDVTEYLIKTLGYDFNLQLKTIYERKVISRLIKEEICYVALDFQNEKINYLSKEYKMPDGNIINIKEQRFFIPEGLFKPFLYGKNLDGIAQNCFNSINKTDNDLKEDLYNCIVLSGGSTLFSGLRERLNEEIEKLAPESMKKKVRVIAEADRKNSAWRGGSILSSLDSFNFWITRDEYYEYGEGILRKIEHYFL